jgi:hypothetical protein
VVRAPKRGGRGGEAQSRLGRTFSRCCCTAEALASASTLSRLAFSFSSRLTSAFRDGTGAKASDGEVFEARGTLCDVAAWELDEAVFVDRTVEGWVRPRVAAGTRLR